MHHISVAFIALFSLWEWKTAQLYKEIELTYETICFLYELLKALLWLGFLFYCGYPDSEIIWDKSYLKWN